MEPKGVAASVYGRNKAQKKRKWEVVQVDDNDEDRMDRCWMMLLGVREGV